MHLECDSARVAAPVQEEHVVPSSEQASELDKSAATPFQQSTSSVPKSAIIVQTVAMREVEAFAVGQDAFVRTVSAVGSSTIYALVA
jgi:hypothetical protein